jgi:dTDP-4-dehydrorhamnose reductase
MKILVVGGSGLVGGQCIEVLSKEYEVSGTHLTFPGKNTFYFNPSNANFLSELPSNNWDVIIHAGALTHVDKCEIEVDLSYIATVVSTSNLVDYSNRIGAQFIYLSTDYIFDGNSGPYIERDPVRPLNVYGTHKLAAENLIIENSEKYLIFRITNVYGDEIRSKNFVARIIQEIRSGKSEFSAPYDQFATPINARDVAIAIKKSLQLNLSGIYHLSSTDYMNRVQLLRKIFEYFPEKDLKVVPLKTEDLNQKANRPLLGGLCSAKFISDVPDFQFTNIDTYLKSKINV